MTELPEITVAQARWINTVEVAKMLRKQLKATFPGVKFSVRISRYSMGSWIDVTWTDGPTGDDVTTLTGAYQGKRFDGIDDLEYSADSWYCGIHGARVSHTRGTGDSRDTVINSRCCNDAELVHFGSGCVHTRREVSPEFRAWLEIETAKWCHQPVYDSSVMVNGEWMDHHLYQIMAKTPWLNG
jgi:hypothetical protein